MKNINKGSIIINVGTVCVKYISISSPAFSFLLVKRESAKPLITDSIIAATEEASVTDKELIKYCLKLLYVNKRLYAAKLRIWPIDYWQRV